MVEHPPLKLLDPRFIWIPTGEDHHGYNDRHAVCSEKNIHHYLNSFEFMINLKARDYLVHTDLNHEQHLKYHLDYCGVGVGRFNNVAYITANQNSSTNWATVKSKLIDGKEYYYKYENELVSCIKNADEFEDHKNWSQLIFAPAFTREKIRLLKVHIIRVLKLQVKFKYPWIWKLLKLFTKDKK